MHEAQFSSLGERLAVGEVSLYCVEDEDLVAHVTCTYALPPATSVHVEDDGDELPTGE